MRIIAQCPECNSAWLINEKDQDRRVRCKKCRKAFRVPKLDEVPLAADVIKQAKGAVFVDESGKTFG